RTPDCRTRSRRDATALPAALVSPGQAGPGCRTETPIMSMDRSTDDPIHTVGYGRLDRKLATPRLKERSELVWNRPDGRHLISQPDFEPVGVGDGRFPEAEPGSDLGAVPSVPMKLRHPPPGRCAWHGHWIGGESPLRGELVATASWRQLHAVTAVVRRQSWRREAVWRRSPRRTAAPNASEPLCK